MNFNGNKLAFVEAADELCARSGDCPTNSAAQELLKIFGYSNLSCREEIYNKATLLKFAARMGVVQPYRCPLSPGLLFFLGLFDQREMTSSDIASKMISSTGSGTHAGRAFEACIGEAVEYASQLTREEEDFLGRDWSLISVFDEREQHSLAKILGFDLTNIPRDIRFIAGKEIGGERDDVVPIPADLCLRCHPMSDRAKVAAPLSIGCAAAPSRGKAILSGLLELVERDAVALWWRGGRPGSIFPLDSPASTAGGNLLREIRQDAVSRTTWLIDITTDIGVPCVAALSANSEGREIACGLAAALAAEEAVTAAIREMCQFEMGYHLIKAKLRANSDYHLNEQEERQLQRGSEIIAHRELLLYPTVFPRKHAVSQCIGNSERAIACIVDRLHAAGLNAYYVDLTRAEFGIPVTKVIVPGLQLDPCGISTDRLRNVASANNSFDRLDWLSLH